MADEYDFQINDLKFRAAISDKHPYQRATAPFRKEQFDSAPTVGDQSLTGWWTRGQLSFHGGAGVKYYEVLDGETILNRFWDGQGVRVSTPGQASLYNTWQDMATATADIACATSSSTMVAWTTAGGAVKSATGTGAVTTHTVPSGTAAGPLAITPQHIFAVAENPTTGTPNRIDRIRVGAAGDASLAGYYTTDPGTGVGPAILDLFYEKGRIWFVEDTGQWRVITVAGDSVVDVFKAPGEDLTGEAPGGVWKFAATPGPVYMARDNVVFYSTVSDDGSVPTLTAPVVVATLPAGDRITGIHYYLGHLVITSTGGVRVALIGDSGSLLTGPVLTTWPNGQAGMTGAALENTLYVYGEHAEDGLPYVHAIDLDSPIGDSLRYAYARLPGSLPATTGRGGTLATEGYLYWWSEGAGMKVMEHPATSDTTARTLTTSGYVTTGYHRFGTLDPKSFRTVTVRCGGDGGQVEVFRVDADGTTTSLGTVTPAEAAKDFAIGLTGPAERIALKFVLTRDALDATKGPELLGYQIKAQPVPERMRLLGWPLMVTDTFRTRYGKERGTAGGAFTALTALEALESSQAVVTFTDHRTGETGSAYIEGVEFESNTPSSHNTTGFGGVAQLTLRVLD